MTSLKNHLAMARPSHWFKNLFMLPGTLIALAITYTPFWKITIPFFLGITSACLIASANYVINEWVDAKSDNFHPHKKKRVTSKGKLKISWVYLEYALFSVWGLILASLVSGNFLVVSIIFLAMGFFYNVRPFRTKDRVYLDVLSESLNNPIRLLLGWFMVTDTILAPLSLILGYWMAGAFLMSVKRYAELRNFSDKQTAAKYRRSFKFYTEKKLLVTSFLYAACSFFFMGVFIIKYRPELILSLPFFIILVYWYLYIGMQPHSVVQHPELLYRKKTFLAYCIFLAGISVILLYCDIPGLYCLLK